MALGCSDVRKSELLNLEALCVEVGNFPLLYDKTRFDHKDRLKRFKAWTAISKAIGAPVRECQKSWRSIRDRYVRELRLAQETGGTTDVAARIAKWSLFKYLDFLHPCLSRQTKRSVTNSPEPDDDTSQTEHNQMESKPILTQEHSLERPRRNRAILPNYAVQPNYAIQPTYAVQPGYAAEPSQANDLGSECAVLQPETFTQSVIMSMLGASSPTEVITPDEPAPTSCGSARGEGSSAVVMEVCEPPRKLHDKNPEVAVRIKEEIVSREPSKRSRHRDEHGLFAQSWSSAMASRGLTGAEECRLKHLDPEDCETMFLLSLRDRLKNLEPKRKSLAQIKIQEALHQIEFGE